MRLCAHRLLSKKSRRIKLLQIHAQIAWRDRSLYFMSNAAVTAPSPSIRPKHAVRDSHRAPTADKKVSEEKRQAFCPNWRVDILMAFKGGLKSSISPTIGLEEMWDLNTSIEEKQGNTA